MVTRAALVVRGLAKRPWLARTCCTMRRPIAVKTSSMVSKCLQESRRETPERRITSPTAGERLASQVRRVGRVASVRRSRIRSHFWSATRMRWSLFASGRSSPEAGRPARGARAGINCSFALDINIRSVYVQLWMRWQVGFALGSFRVAGNATRPRLSRQPPLPKCVPCDTRTPASLECRSWGRATSALSAH